MILLLFLSAHKSAYCNSKFCIVLWIASLHYAKCSLLWMCLYSHSIVTSLGFCPWNFWVTVWTETHENGVESLKILASVSLVNTVENSFIFQHVPMEHPVPATFYCNLWVVLVENFTRTKNPWWKFAVFIHLKDSKHANYFNYGMSSVSLERELCDLEHKRCCVYPMEGQIFAYM